MAKHPALQYRMLRILGGGVRRTKVLRNRNEPQLEFTFSCLITQIECAAPPCLQVDHMTLFRQLQIMI